MISRTMIERGRRIEKYATIAFRVAVLSALLGAVGLALRFFP